MSSFSGAVFSLNSKSPTATISARRMNVTMKSIDTMRDSRIWVLAASLAVRRFNLCQDVQGVHGSEPWRWQPGFARAS
eukprot:7209908-Heterocapsa_arctica.AAC.1